MCRLTLVSMVSMVMVSKCQLTLMCPSVEPGLNVLLTQRASPVTNERAQQLTTQAVVAAPWARAGVNMSAVPEVPPSPTPVPTPPTPTHPTQLGSGKVRRTEGR